jgi:hypothetical protein
LVSSSGRISDHVDELSVLLQAENLLTSWVTTDPPL